MGGHAYSIASVHVLAQCDGGGWNVSCSEVGAGQEAHVVQSVHIGRNIDSQWWPPSCDTLASCSSVGSYSGPKRKPQEALRLLGALALVQEGGHVQPEGSAVPVELVTAMKSYAI